MTRLRGDSGVATALVLALSAVLGTVGSAAVGLGSVQVARQRAVAVADLAALAAAQAAQAGLDAPAACARATVLAERSGARLSACAVDGAAVTVTARVRPPTWLARFGEAGARARAGPSD